MKADEFNLKYIESSDLFEAKCANARTNSTLFYEIISEEIIDCILWAEENKDLLCDLDEDIITLFIVATLRGRFKNQFIVTHDSHNGGHTDIKIQAGSNIWLGEAKRRVNGNSYILDGFRQLVDRYATGSPTCSTGGLFIYLVNESPKKKATETLKDWKLYLEENFENLEFIESHQKSREGLSLITRHPHSTTGLPYTVHHHLFVLQHFPTDRK
jgi:hypothetical protein